MALPKLGKPLSWAERNTAPVQKLPSPGLPRKLLNGKSRCGIPRLLALDISSISISKHDTSIPKTTLDS